MARAAGVLALCAGFAAALDEHSLLQSQAAVSEAPLPRTALLAVCFASKASPGRHTTEQLTDGCLINIASFKMAAPNSDMILIAPTEEMAADRVKKVAQKDPSVKIEYVGMGPWEVGGKTIPFADAAGHFYGNSLKLLWYTQVQKKLAGQYDYTFIADGADIFFQRNPFELAVQYPTADLMFFGDRNDIPSRGVEFFNRMMPLCTSRERKDPVLLNKVQEAFTREVGGRSYGVYANSGLILGKAQAMLELTSRVAEMAAECNYWRSDQSIVNLVRYYETNERGADKVLMFPDMEHSVSLGKYRWYRYTDDGWLANKQTLERLYVVHQYDRSPDAEKLMWLAKKKTKEWIESHE